MESGVAFLWDLPSREGVLDLVPLRDSWVMQGNSGL
jgi:hypothetical protein